MILITGATGFIGPHLVKALGARGEPVRCLVRDLARARLLQALGAELMIGDVRDPSSLERAFKSTKCTKRAKCDGIIHMAKLHEGSAQAMKAVNVVGTANLIKAAQRAGVKRFVHVSALGAVPKPHFPYAYSEWQAEELVGQSGLDHVILRPAIIIGGGDLFTSGLIRLVRHWPFVLIPGSGQTKYQPLWIADFVRCLISALDETLLSGDIIAIGGGEIVTLEEMICQTIQFLGRPRPLIHLPRRPMRAVVRSLRRVGLRTPWIPGHFLSTPNIAEPDAIQRNFGFQPRRWRDLLPELMACCSEQNLLA